MDILTSLSRRQAFKLLGGASALLLARNSLIYPAHATALSITAANISVVSAPEGSILDGQIAAAAITVGQAVYKLDNGTWGLAQGDGTAVEAGANDVGIAISGASAAGQRISVARGGAIIGFGAILTAGLFYIVGDTAGSIYPSADAGTGDKTTLLGQAISTSQLLLIRAYNAGAAIA